MLNDRNHRKIKVEGLCKDKARPRQWKVTLDKIIKPLHDDVMDIYRMLIDHGGTVHIKIETDTDKSGSSCGERINTSDNVNNN